MPRAPKRCAHSDCDQTVTGKSYCPQHNSRWPTRKARRVPAPLQRACFERDRYTCTKCGHTGQPGDGTLHADHITQPMAGGLDVLSNMQTLCKTCHNRKTRAEAAAARG